MPRVVHYKRMGYRRALPGDNRPGGAGRPGAAASTCCRRRPWCLVGLGIGPLFPDPTVCVQNAVDGRDMGVATATLAFLRTLGSALGVAAFGAIIFAFGVVA